MCSWCAKWDDIYDLFSLFVCSLRIYTYVYVDSYMHMPKNASEFIKGRNTSHIIYATLIWLEIVTSIFPDHLNNKKRPWWITRNGFLILRVDIEYRQIYCAFRYYRLNGSQWFLDKNWMDDTVSDFQKAGLSYDNKFWRDCTWRDSER